MRIIDLCNGGMGETSENRRCKLERHSQQHESEIYSAGVWSKKESLRFTTTRTGRRTCFAVAEESAVIGPPSAASRPSYTSGARAKVAHTETVRVAMAASPQAAEHPQAEAWSSCMHSQSRTPSDPRP